MGRLKSIIKDFLINQTPLFIKKNIICDYQKSIIGENLSYSQEGEDRVLLRFFENKQLGFYIDIGAHHPTRFSNTYLFYLRGWAGINIDAMPGSMKAFHEIRSRDINLEIPISSKKELLTYYSFNEPALNTFSKTVAKRRDGIRDYRIIESIEMETSPLSDVLDKYLPKNQVINFMSIDVEGLDFDVIQSNNWEKYSPEMVLIESTNASMENVHNNPIYKFLKNLEYELVAKTFNTLIFNKCK